MKRRRPAEGAPPALEPFHWYVVQPALIDWRHGRVLAWRTMLMQSVGFMLGFGQ